VGGEDEELPGAPVAPVVDIEIDELAEPVQR
jgi:hypothetical protein